MNLLVDNMNRSEVMVAVGAGLAGIVAAINLMCRSKVIRAVRLAKCVHKK